LRNSSVTGCLVAVLERERQIDRIARAPHAAVAVNVALQTVDDGLAADVKVADRQRDAVRHAQVALAAVLLRDQRERLALHVQLDHAVAIGVARGDDLVLVVDRVDLHARERLGTVQCRRDRQQLALGGTLGDQADVGGEEVALVADVLAPAVVSRLAGVRALVPVDLAVLAFAVVVVPVRG
jgi:hypothetical protein